jgi:polyhydroxybutyrate depolymerase
MRSFAASVRRGSLVLVAGCAALGLACGSGKSQSGSGGASGSGGTTDLSDAAPTGSGGTTTGGSTTVPVNTGGSIGSGGTSDPLTGSGGTTVITGSGGRPGSGGRAGSGGTVGSGGRTGSGGGGAGVPTGGTSSGGVTTKPDAAAGGTSDASPGSGGSTTADGGAAVPSAGCGNKSNPSSGRFNITVGGAAREDILTLPDNYDTNRPYRLVFGFHGAKYSADWVATGQAPAGGVALSGPFFGIASESAGSTIFVAPQASGTWGDGDLAFVDAMLAQFEDQLCIDKSRIFSVGFSMGAIMTIRIACARSTVFRAVAPMSGSLPSPCPTGQHIAYWASHATNDQTIPIAQGQAARDEFVKRNHCGTQTSAPDANNCITYQDCDPGYPAIWCTFTGTSSGQNGHEPAPFAGPAIWKFLAPL